MDIIKIKDLKVPTTIGVFSWEKKIRQCLYVTIETQVDAKYAADQDDLTKTLDYHAMAQVILDFGKEKSFQLIETFAEKLFQCLKERFPLRWAKICIVKPRAILEAEEVSITIEREV